MIKPNITLGSLPTSFLESMSYYESLIWMINYIQELDKRIDGQDEKIDEAIAYMKDNLLNTVTELFNTYLENGDIQASLNEEYDGDTESLVLSISATPSE